MRFTLSSTALSSQLSILSKVINSKSTFPILNSFLMEVKDDKLTITASDSENVMITSLPLDICDSEGRFAVKCTTILDAVRELPEQPLTMEVDTEALTVKVLYQNGIYNFMGQDASEYPVKAVLEGEPTVLTLPSVTLADTISRSIFATATEELRPVMNGIYFDMTAEALAVVASDGHKLVRNKLFNVKTEQPTAFIMPKKPAGLLRAVLAKDEGDVIVNFDGKMAEITFGDSLLQCRLIEGRYPNYNAVIPQDNPNVISVDRKTLSGVLKRVLPFASESSRLVRMRLETGKIVISSEDIDFATSAKEEITCDYMGTSMSIGFMGQSLLDILMSLTCDEVKIELADPSRPCIVIPEQQPENEEVVMLIMPMLLND